MQPDALYASLRTLNYFMQFTQRSKTLFNSRTLRILRVLTYFTQFYTALGKANKLYAILRKGE